jgi:hypothetical protein
LYPEEIQKYIVELFERRNEGSLVQQVQIKEGEWEPEFHECHKNVDFWCKVNPEYKPVRGWVFYAFDYEANFVWFLQHSVMRTPENILVDITPNNASDSYPFIIATESDDDFFAKEKYLMQGNLVHIYK